MSINKITLNEAVYEVHRVYVGTKTISDIIKERLSESRLHIMPLTNACAAAYNLDGEDRGVREAQ